MKAVVVGAGIGGLATAAALRGTGWRVTVLERAPVLGPVGAGIVLAPNAVHALDALGAGAEVRAVAQTMTATGIRDANGRWLNRVDATRLAARYGAPSLAVHRAALHRALLDLLPPGCVRTGVTVDDPDGLDADLVVAADGAASLLRTRVFGPAHRLAYAGLTAWRGVVAAPAAMPAATVEAWGRGQAFGYVPLGDARVYWFATAAVPEGTRFDDDLGELRRRFGGWHAPIPDLLAATDPAALLRPDVRDLRPDLPSYVRGRVALLGDAAHAMTPNLGQGAGMALEDAVTLGACLHTGDLAAGLATYDAARRRRTQAVARRSRQVARLMRRRDPVTTALRDLAIRHTPGWLGERQAAVLMRWTNDVPPGPPDPTAVRVEQHHP